MLAADILARLLRAPAELLTGVVVAFIGAPCWPRYARPEGGSMSMPPAHDACGAMRARPSTPRRSCAPAAGWPYRCRRAHWPMARR